MVWFSRVDPASPQAGRPVEPIGAQPSLAPLGRLPQWELLVQPAAGSVGKSLNLPLWRATTSTTLRPTQRAPNLAKCRVAPQVCPLIDYSTNNIHCQQSDSIHTSCSCSRATIQFGSFYFTTVAPSATACRRPSVCNHKTLAQTREIDERERERYPGTRPAPVHGQWPVQVGSARAQAEPGCAPQARAAEPRAPVPSGPVESRRDRRHLGNATTQARREGPRAAPAAKGRPRRVAAASFSLFLTDCAPQIDKIRAGASGLRPASRATDWIRTGPNERNSITRNPSWRASLRRDSSASGSAH